MSQNHQDANQTPAPARLRRGPVFSLNPFPPRSGVSQFATPPRFQFPEEPYTDDAGSIFRSSGRPSQGFFRAPNRTFDISSPLKGDRNKALQVSDDEIEDDLDDTKNTTCNGDEAFIELDDIFPVSRRSNKRPWTSPHSAHRAAITNHDVIDDNFDDEIKDSSPPIPDSSSPPPIQSRSKNPKLESPTPRPQFTRRLVDDELSGPESFEPLSQPQTPKQDHVSLNIDGHPSSMASSTFQNRPRFILSANYTPASTATPAASTPQPTRKKPTFVLPRSPSPKEEDALSSAIPVPFSPMATRTLRRTGRPKLLATATYVPGGMAEHLRDWIMEADMKRKASSDRQLNQKQNDARFAIIGRIDSCHNAFLKSSGPVIMAQITLDITRKDEPPNAHNETQRITVLLLGVSASRAYTNNTRQSSTDGSTSDERLKPSDIIGIGPHLSWEIEVGPMKTNETTSNVQTPGHRVVPSSQSDSEGDFEDQGEEVITPPGSSAHPTHSTQKTWLVAAEWDLLN
ncbi:hypothetical protein TMatcc_008096 [Talaromyces marneffei ATCC 18224]|uniref:Uncharacterized protein n=1 Tax=Talaromyces marneffei (strain ATCC 18224 / CBS 334.59 / QM 7333) TaxID=441960 RepID=B6QEM2_TALMQ|nr:conserved hypothetical protein [Talaromyces marneffei ATCC 18224]KAE8552540.1 hypothetical protein EYB25_003918 [Talaromyces marneffei]